MKKHVVCPGGIALSTRRTILRLKKLQDLSSKPQRNPMAASWRTDARCFLHFLSPFSFPFLYPFGVLAESSSPDLKRRFNSCEQHAPFNHANHDLSLPTEAAHRISSIPIHSHRPTRPSLLPSPCPTPNASMLSPRASLLSTCLLLPTPNSCVPRDPTASAHRQRGRGQPI